MTDEWETRTLAVNMIHIRRIDRIPGEGFIVAVTPHAENAEQIVREHNEHEGLVEALEAMLIEYGKLTPQMKSEDDPEIVRKAQVVYLQAKAQEAGS